MWATMNWRNSKKSPKWQNKYKKDTSNDPLLGEDFSVYTRQITQIRSSEIKASPLTHVGKFVS